MRLLLAAALLAGALLAPAGPAQSHAVVLETVPADGAVLDRAPAAVIVRFSEPVTPIAAQVLDGEGKNVLPSDALTGAGDELRLALPAALPDGSYVASYRVVSVDSHPIGGSLVFTIGAASRLAPSVAGHEREWGWRTLLLALKVALYAGLLGGAGGALFVLLVRPEGAAAAGAARSATAFAAAGGIAALLAIGAEGGLLLAAPPGDLVGLELWQAGLQSTFGRSAVTAACGLALVAAALRRHPTIAGFGAAAALASLALTGHVVTAGPQWLTVPVLIVHASTAAFWLGSPSPASPRDRRARNRRRAARAAVLADRPHRRARADRSRYGDRHPAGRQLRCALRHGLWPHPHCKARLACRPACPRGAEQAAPHACAGTRRRGSRRRAPPQHPRRNRARRRHPGRDRRARDDAAAARARRKAPRTTRTCIASTGTADPRSRSARRSATFEPS